MAAPRPATSKLSLTAPLTRNSLNTIRSTLEEHYATQIENYDPSEVHAAVLAPFCNLNDKPGILLEVRGKLRTHSGEVRCEEPLRHCLESVPFMPAHRWLY